VNRRLALLALVFVVVPAPAFAHGDIESTAPADGDHVIDPPTEVRIDFTQPPTADSKFEVADGCDRDVLAGVEGEGPNAVLRIEEGGSTGAWEVRYRVISATDGHLTRGNFSFLVGRGPLRCDEPAPPDSTEVASPVPPEAAGDDGTNGDGFPVVPVLIGGGVIVALAVAVRMLSGG
jgi:methionine-rich copper-binding protein CopC